MATTNSTDPQKVGKKNTEKSVPISVYRRHIERARDAGNYFTFSRDYVISGAMNKLQALFIQDLINLAALKSTAKDDDDYFLCTVEYLEGSLCWERETQQGMLRSLGSEDYTFKGTHGRETRAGKRFLKTKYVGMPPRRWIWVDLLAIEQAVDVGLDR